jgi:hypothetical protein
VDPKRGAIRKPDTPRNAGAITCSQFPATRPQRSAWRRREYQGDFRDRVRSNNSISLTSAS